MLRDFLPTVHAVFWLCLLGHAVVATIVEDTDPGIRYDSTWSIDGNGYNSGGCAHRTNITGGIATYTFTGTVITLYGVTHIDGAKFSFSVEGGPSQSCTTWRNSTDVWYFKSELCSISGLDGTVQHNLTVKHADVSGLWLGIDYFDVLFTDPTKSVTPSSTPTSFSSSQTSTTLLGTQTQTQSTSPTQKLSSSPNIGAIVGGVVGGVVGLTLVSLVVFFLVMRSRQTRVPLETPNLSEVQGSPSTSPRTEVPGTSSGSTPGTFIFHADAMGSPSSPYDPYVTSPDMSMTDNRHSFSRMPPPSLPSMIERTASSRVPSSSDMRGEGFASLYPAGVASYTVPRGGSTYQPLVHQEDPSSSPSPQGENPQEVEPRDGGYSSSDIDGWRSTAASPPPPSYHTRATGS